MSYNKKEHKSAEKKVRNSHSRKKVIIVLLVCTSVVILGVSSYFLLANYKNKSNDPAGNTDTSRQNYIQTVSDEAKDLVIAEDVAGAIDVYENGIGTTDNISAKQALLVMEATVYANSGDNDSALVAALASEALNNSSDTEQYIATLYERKGDNTNAIIFYKKAIDNINKTDSLAESDVTYYTNKINLLGGTL